nr:YbaN family protein [uncultured Duganella sp.]
MKIVLNLIGCVAVALGVLGIFLPLLPTTPFLLLASACFARGSTRLHHWLQTNRVFGKYLRDYENGKGIPLRGKLWILLFMWGSMGYSMWRLRGTPPLLALLVLIGAGVTLYLTRFVPTMPPPGGAGPTAGDGH